MSWHCDARADGTGTASTTMAVPVFGEENMMSLEFQSTHKHSPQDAKVIMVAQDAKVIMVAQDAKV